MERASRIEVFAMLTLVEDRIAANEAELEVHRHATHHIKVRQLLKRYETFRRYLLGELWLMDREEAKEADGSDTESGGEEVHTEQPEAASGEALPGK